MEDGIYLDVEWTRRYRSKWLQASVDLTMYKGRILLSVAEESDRATALAKHAGVTIGGDAWMNVSDIDAIGGLLREARRVLRQHQADVRKVAACKECSRIFAGVCKRHRALFKKYRRPKRSRGIR
jgi:hypothetical protein